MADQETLELARAWVDLWNNNLEQTPRMVSPQFVSQAAPLFGGVAEDNSGRATLNAWVGGAHQVFRNLTFEMQTA